MELDRLKEGLRARLACAAPFIERYKYVCLVLLAGILLLYAGGGARDEPAAPAAAQDDESGFVLADFEARLEESLSHIQGIGRVELMLSLEETGESVYASNIRHAENGADSGSYESTLSIVSDGSYGEQPVQIQQRCPTFRGAVVLCEGASRDSVRLAVTEAVGAVCGLGADRISVIQMGQ